MPRDDYVRRLIAEMGRAWSRIVTLIRARQFPAARTAVEQAIPQLLGLSIDMARTLAPHELVARLMIGEAPAEGRDKCVALAALLKASGDISTAEGDVDAGAEDYRKALEVLLTVLVHNPEYMPPDYAPPAAELAEALAMYALPLETNQLLMRYYEQIGAYASAENALFEMLDSHPEHGELLALGRDFYTRLLQQSDQRLAAGDLTRREVEAGLSELRRRAV
jgi:tetratricopeptide (TPR) repeat protein